MKKLSDLELAKKKLMIFDMDGTLIDSIGIWNATDCEVIFALSKKTPSPEIVQNERDEFIANNHGTDIYLAYCDFLKDRYKMCLSSKDILSMRWAIANKFLHNDVDYKKNADVLLKKLKNLGFSLALATITSQVQLDVYTNINKNIISKAHLSDIFDLILCKDDVEYKKPHPEIYLKVLQHFDLPAEKALVFEDSLAGVKAAKSAGIEVVNIYDKYSDADRARINELADYNIHHYAEFLEAI